MGNIKSLSKSWLNKEKHKDFKKHISAPFVEKRATFKGTITREQVQDAVQAFLAKGGKINVLPPQTGLIEDPNDVEFQMELNKVKRRLGIFTADWQGASDFLSTEVA